MPNRWPIANGNWSNPAIWNGGAIPTSADDVFTNNQIVFINIDATIRSIRNSATGSAVASAAQGNCFYLNDGVTLTTTAGGVIGAVGNASYFPTIIISGSSSARIVGDVTLGSNPSFQCAIILNNAASLSITGSINSGIWTNAAQSRTIISNSTGTLNISGSLSCSGNTFFGATLRLDAATRVNINGNVFGIIDNQNGGPTILNNSTAIVSITGNIIGANSGVSGTTVIINNSAGSFVITGNVLAGTNGVGIVNNSTGTIIVTGSVAAAAGGYAISNASTGTVSVSGSVTAGTGNSGIISTTAGRITVIGPISASRSFPGIQSTSTGNVFVTGPFLNTNNRNAVFAQNLQLLPGSTPTWRFDTETYGGTKTLSAITAVGGYPDVSNVRSGSVYGDTNQFTGTVIIPSASNVLFGVPVDARTGSALFNTQTIWGVLTSSLTTPGSIGARLRNTATVATDATLITTRRKL